MQLEIVNENSNSQVILNLKNKFDSKFDFDHGRDLTTTTENICIYE